MLLSRWFAAKGQGPGVILLSKAWMHRGARPPMAKPKLAASQELQAIQAGKKMPDARRGED
jgi:hypothetical protein